MQTVSALTPRVSNNIADMPHDSVANGPVDFDFDAADEETSLCICVFVSVCVYVCVSTLSADALPDNSASLGRRSRFVSGPHHQRAV